MTKEQYEEKLERLKKLLNQEEPWTREEAIEADNLTDELHEYRVANRLIEKPNISIKR